MLSLDFKAFWDNQPYVVSVHLASQEIMIYCDFGKGPVRFIGQGARLIDAHVNLLKIYRQAMSLSRIGKSVAS